MDMHVIDRRQNPKGKSSGNRQRYFGRCREQLRKEVAKAAGKRKIADVEGSHEITIYPTDGTREPTFRHAEQGGHRESIHPGNKEYVEGDTIPRPPNGGGGKGSQGSPDGEGEDAFRFILTKEEFLELFLEDLELPDMVKKRITAAQSFSYARAGYSTTGSPSNMDLNRTARNSLRRRMALKRPKLEEVEEVEQRLAEARQGDDGEMVELLEEELKTLTRRRTLVPFMDKMDVRYRRYKERPKPIAQAAMFCLMDVSGSMNEVMKDLAKRFFILLYLFLDRSYEKVEIVFIRHTQVASEVDEQTFFHSRDSGGTMISSAYKEMLRIIRERFPSDEWNIYGAQATDGDNFLSDNPATERLLDQLLPLCQYFAYIEVGERSRESDFWAVIQSARERHAHLASEQVSRKGDVYPVFRKLFSKERQAA